MGLAGCEARGCLIEGQAGMAPRNQKYMLKSKQFGLKGKVKGKGFLKSSPCCL